MFKLMAERRDDRLPDRVAESGAAWDEVDKSRLVRCLGAISVSVQARVLKSLQEMFSE